LRLSEILSENLVLCGLKARTKRKALIELIRCIVKCGKVTDEETLKKAVLGREKLQSTGIGRGIAVPHGVVKPARGLACALGVSRKGLSYTSIDGQPVHLIFLFVNSKTRDVHYLSLLASVCRLFENENLRKNVISAVTPEDVLRLIRQEEAKECQYLGNLPH
jgi:mannitol/fructose-specific phosphotransferase system IIA component (Ntr-type)